MLETRQHLMRCPTDIRILIPVELHQCIVDSILQSFRTAIAYYMQNSLADAFVFIANQFEDSVPENLDVPLNFAWAKLLDGFESDIVILGVSVLKNEIDVVSIPANGHELLPVGFFDLVAELLLVVFALFHNYLYVGGMKYLRWK